MPKARMTDLETRTAATVEWTQLSAGQFRVVCGQTERQITMRKAGGQSLLCLPDGSCHRYESVQVGRVIWLWLDGRVWRFEKEATGRKSAGSHLEPTRELVAPMPGNILKIHKSTGEVYNADEPLIVIESMKMELTLSAPAKGKLIEVLCEVGELVPLGKVLAKLEPTE